MLSYSFDRTFNAGQDDCKGNHHDNDIVFDDDYKDDKRVKMMKTENGNTGISSFFSVRATNSNRNGNVGHFVIIFIRITCYLAIIII